MGENTIHIDCDVLQADGGTRTASITGGCIALADAIRYGYEQGLFADHVLQHLVASVSVGIVNGEPVLDLDYAEDSTANTDMNVVMTDENKFIEIQGTAETNAFSADEYQSMITLAQNGIKEIMEKQKYHWISTRSFRSKNISMIELITLILVRVEISGLTFLFLLGRIHTFS